ncbi:MAG: SpoIIE family protein phosphatase [Planctomycetes bacterium]|nr:SpoIIE family protein phosphatase [Planctomycetota bacterium]
MVMLVLFSVAVQGTMFLAARRTVRTLSAAVIEKALDQTESQLNRFFDPVVSGINFVRSWGESGLLFDEKPLDLDDVNLQATEVIGSINSQLIPLMQQSRHISSILLADERGREHMILRIGESWSIRKTRRDLWEDEVLFIKWSDAEPEYKVSRSNLIYDPRSRPWYVGAENSDSNIVWTEPYTFFTADEPGITASTKIDMGDGLTHLVGFDVLLNDISKYTIGLEPTDNGVAFVMAEDGAMIGLPRHERFLDSEVRRKAILKQPIDLGIPYAADSVKAYRELPEDAGDIYRFHSEGKAWWAGIRPFTLSEDRSLLIAVAIPESDLLGGLSEMRMWILIISIGVLLGAIARVFVLSNLYCKPIEALVDASDRISKGDLERGVRIESRIYEVRRLARAQDRMRLSLQSLMKLERDIQLARQIQQSTFPKELPIVKGFDIAAWSEPADETGGDTYDVIGYTYDVIGLAGDIDQRSHAGQTREVDRAVLLMADATGHGIGPALSVTQIRAMLRIAVRAGEPITKIVQYLNEQLCADLLEGRFITAWLGELNSADHSLLSISAGQAPLLHYKAKIKEVEILNADTLPLGISSELQINVSDAMHLKRGDIFAVISDGVFEAVNRAGEQFGTQRVIDVICQHHRLTPNEILEHLRLQLAGFTEGLAAADDRTAIFVKRTGR